MKTLLDLPQEILFEIALWLSSSDIRTLRQVHPSFANRFNNNSFWRHMCKRDYHDFLHNWDKLDRSLFERDFHYQPTSDLDETFTIERIRNAYHNFVDIQTGKDWSRRYQVYEKFKWRLDGLWYAQYGAHGSEIVAVEHHGFSLRIVKVTGDVYVPRGKVSVEVPILSIDTDDKMKGYGRVQFADFGYRNARWVECVVFSSHVNNLDVKWLIRVDGRQYMIPLIFQRLPSRITRKQVKAAIRKCGPPDFLGNVNNVHVATMLKLPVPRD